jgi:hypothetical protein
MPCHSSIDGTVHVCAPHAVGKFVNAGICPDCKKWSRFIGLHYEWYGTDQTCLRCGRSWSDGEWMPLNFERQSRQKSIASAKHIFRHAVVEPLSFDRTDM